MIDNDLRLRAKRLLSGVHRAEDLDRLFLDQRDRHHGKSCFREIGDFVAHRQERQKGLVTQVAGDVFTSVRVWSLGLRKKTASRADIAQAAWANFRLASDLQLKQGCGLRRAIAKRRLESGVPKFEAGQILSDQEADVISYLGNRFIWKPAFTDDQLFKEFGHVLLQNSIIERHETATLDEARAFLTLYAISRMHGSQITLGDGMKGEVLAGFANRERRLEVKVMITFLDAPKPITAPICMFLSSLQPEAHCEPALLDKGNIGLPNAWDEPIEVGDTGKLMLIR